VNEITRGGRHMCDVVNVVLDYARIEARGPVLHMRQIEIADLVEDCVAVVQPAALARGLHLQVALAPDLPAQFVTDDVQLRRILGNLLSNAVKYTPAGGVELRVGGDAAHLRIEVADTGIGIPEGRRHHLFEEYERFGAERTTIEGTGLGLAIAHRLARRMGGYMGHRDNPGGGSIFWLELPAGDAPEARVVIDAPAQPEALLNVLVVDDSEINREVAASFLRQGGHRVVEAHDGSEAVQLAAAQDFDVVLMDMRMAAMDGLEATRRIRALPGSRGQVPIVAVTANALDQHAEQCRRAGMADHLPKPFTQAELLAVVGRSAARRVQPVADLESMGQLAACMGEEAARRLLDCLSLRIEALLRRLEEAAPFASAAELADLAHELAGSSGTLGFSRLAAAARRFEAAVAAGSADADELRHEATSTLTDLRRRRTLEAMLTG
jgi:CheY-like chemotaxis protein/HPt (histidine-containing phosphotransfer) domain-containing protein